MSGNWTVGQVLELAPDAGSEKAGRGLARAEKWSLLGRDGRTLWGEIKGSGKNPYQTRIDLSEPAFKCSCPSRKFPCKHSLGLFLIFAENPGAVAEGERPGWVADWLSSREERAARKADRAGAVKDKPVDATAQAKRSLAREDRIAGGLDELSVWLQDIARRGLAGLRAEPYSFWEGMAARMVDAQAPGLSRMVRQLGGNSNSGEGWDSRLLEGIGRLHTVIEGYRRIDSVDAGLRAELRSAIGWTVGKDELAALPGHRDRWAVLGRRVVAEDKLRTQFTWLRGTDTGRWALILDFAAGNRPFESSLSVGSSIDAELVYFPGAVELRAQIREHHGDVQSGIEFHGAATVAEALASFAAALARVPWLERWPVALAAVRVVPHGAGGDPRWLLVDGEDRALPVDPRFAFGWELLAASGGMPVAIFGEWSGEFFRPLSARAGGRFFTVGRSDERQTFQRVA